MTESSSNQTYPATNLFLSEQWQERARALELALPPFAVEPYKGLRLARPRAGTWSDLEPWPTAEAPRSAALNGADWLVHRKLLPETRPASDLPAGAWVTEWAVAPWLDLTQPITVKKEVQSHIGRTERKITRELAAPVLVRARADDRQRWFDDFAAFERPTGRFTEEQLALFGRWVTEGEMPEWMRLMSLECELPQGWLRLAMGLFYCWQGVYYYYAPVMNPAAELRKYGPGKLFVQKLIDSALAEGCHTFDFLQGDHEYKFHWNPQVRRLQQCIVPLTFKGRVALGGFRLKKWMQEVRA